MRIATFLGQALALTDTGRFNGLTQQSNGVQRRKERQPE
jgi:hypothetical protein